MLPSLVLYECWSDTLLAVPTVLDRCDNDGAKQEDEKWYCYASHRESLKEPHRQHFLTQCFLVQLKRSEWDLQEDEDGEAETGMVNGQVPEQLEQESQPEDAQPEAVMVLKS